jgi:hypothetical protein
LMTFSHPVSEDASAQGILIAFTILFNIIIYIVYV